MDIKSINNILKVSEIKNQNKTIEISEPVKNINAFNNDLSSVNSKNVELKNFDQIFKIPESANLNKANYNSKIFPNGIKGISPSDINQNQIGDCYFLSCLACLAQNKPKEINVKIPTDDEISKGGGAGKGSNGSIWVAILEKAYLQDHTFGKTQVEKSGFMIGKGISDLTGHGNDTDYLTITRNSTTRNKLEEKLNSGKIVLGSTFGDGDESKNISSSHVYSILAYDRKTDLITIKNPWGASGEPNGIKNNDGISDGVFKLTMSEFNDMFSLICYEN
jgi:hypothetical protein